MNCYTIPKNGGNFLNEVMDTAQQTVAHVTRQTVMTPARQTFIRKVDYACTRNYESSAPF